MKKKYYILIFIIAVLIILSIINDMKTYNAKYVYATKVINEISEGSRKRPKNKKVYLKYTIENNELTDEVPYLCVYKDKELCLKNNDYKNSAKKIKKYFNYSKEWKKDGDMWISPDGKIICRIEKDNTDCADENIFIIAYKTGSIDMNDKKLGYSCGIDDLNDVYCG